MSDTEKKKIVMTLCKTFPMAHPKAGEPTGFKDALLLGRKIHTIRRNLNGIWDKRADQINAGTHVLCLRQWSGAPYCSKQAEVKRVPAIGLQRVTMSFAATDIAPTVVVDGKVVPLGTIAANDGLAIDDFIDWFFGCGNVWEGVIIHFTDFRY